MKKKKKIPGSRGTNVKVLRLGLLANNSPIRKLTM